MAGEAPMPLFNGTYGPARGRGRWCTVDMREWCRMTLLTSPNAAASTGLDAETLKMTLEAIRDFVGDAIPEERQLQLDHEDVCPEDVVRGMCSDQLGIQLLFIPEEYGGMGGGTHRRLPGVRADGPARHRPRHQRPGHLPRQRPDIRRRHARAEARVADRDRGEGHPVRVRRDRTRGRQRPRRAQDDRDARSWPTAWSTGYRLNGRKQWISNGGIADKYTILARAPGGPSWFVLDRGTDGFHPEQAGGQARHPAVQHGGAVPRRCLRPGREPGRRRRRAGPHPGAEGLRLHPADGRRPSASAAAGPRSTAPSSTRPPASRAARRCQPSRATPTS